MSTIQQITFLSLIIHGLAFVEYSFSSPDTKNLVENCITEYQNCSSVDGKVICYRLCSNIRLSWNDAQRICVNHNSMLPLIRNRKEQESLESYLKSHAGISVAWTSGRKVTHDQWTWLNGQPFRGLFVNESTNSEYNTHASIGRFGRGYYKDLKLRQANPLHYSWYMCQYRGNSCDRRHTIILTNSCVFLSNNTISWYDARNVCLDGGGDLAVLSDEDLKILESHRSAEGAKQYWIGLEKISWQWKFLNNESEDVKYSKWSRSEFLLDSDLCISIQASNSEWVARNCSVSNSIICQSDAAPISPTSTLGSVMYLTSINNLRGYTDGGPDKTVLAFNGPCDEGIASGFGIGFIVALVLFFVVFFILFRLKLLQIRRISGNSSAGSSKATDAKSTKEHDMIEPAQPEATYASLQNEGDSHCYTSLAEEHKKRRQ